MSKLLEFFSQVQPGERLQTGGLGEVSLSVPSLSKKHQFVRIRTGDPVSLSLPSMSKKHQFVRIRTGDPDPTLLFKN